MFYPSNFTVVPECIMFSTSYPHLILYTVNKTTASLILTTNNIEETFECSQYADKVLN